MRFCGHTRLRCSRTFQPALFLQYPVRFSTRDNGSASVTLCVIACSTSHHDCTRFYDHFANLTRMNIASNDCRCTFRSRFWHTRPRGQTRQGPPSRVGICAGHFTRASRFAFIFYSKSSILILHHLIPKLDILRGPTVHMSRYRK